jgi:branched-chain amino acid transport system ATP-binding protein
MLKVNNLNVNYGAVHALSNVSLEVNDGELVTLIGANGAGKTTTLHAISGLLGVASGSIELDGTDLRKTPAGRIISKGLAHVPEGRHVFSEMTVLENLYMGAYSIKDKSISRCGAAALRPDGAAGSGLPPRSSAPPCRDFQPSPRR